MVTQMGMSDLFGSVDLHSGYSNLSSETKQNIENEVRRLLDEGRQRALKVLSERRRDLDVLAKALVEYEVLTADEMRRVIKGEKLQKLKSLPNSPIKVPDFLANPPSPGGGGGLGGNEGLGGVGGLGVPGRPPGPEGNGGAKL